MHMIGRLLLLLGILGFPTLGSALQTRVLLAAANQIQIQPEQIALSPSQDNLFFALLRGVKPREVRWSIEEGPSGGSVQSLGSFGNYALARYSAPAATGTFHLKASARGLSAVSIVLVQLPPEKPQIQSFSASPSMIMSGQSSTLNWSVLGATLLSLDQGIGTVTGTSRTVSPSITTTYTLTASNAVGSVISQTTLTVQSQPSGAPVIQSFTANPARLSAGESTTLNWNVSGARAVSLTPYGLPMGNSVVLQPQATTVYTLMAINEAGSFSSAITVTVDQAQSARNLHVAQNGNDTTGDGTVSKPFRTVQKAVDMAQSEDSVWIHSGTYDGEVRIRRPRITLQSVPGEWAHLRTPINDENQGMTVYLDVDAQGCVLKRLEISGGYYYALKTESTWDWDRSSKIRWGSANLLIEECILHDSGRDVIKIVPGVDDVTIRRCTIYNSGMRDNSNAEGIDNVNGDRMTVEDCYIHHTATNGIYAKGGAIGCLIQRNLFMHCGGGGVLLGFDTSPEWFDTDVNPGYFECIDSKALNNIIVHTNWEGLGFYGALRCQAAHNTVVNAAKQTHSALHFGVMLHDWETGIPCPGSKNVDVSNNIFVQDPSSNLPMVQIRYTQDNGGISGFQGMPAMFNNRYFRSSGAGIFQDRRANEFLGNFAQWQTHTQSDQGSSEGDPGLDSNYHLISASYCIDRGKTGLGVNDDYESGVRTGTPDIGADERGAGTFLTVPPPAGVIGTGNGSGSIPQLPVISSFAANPATIQQGQSSTLSWNVSGATTLSLEPGIGGVIGQNSRSVSPTQTTVYTLTASNAVGSAGAQATVTVTPAPQLPVIASFSASPSTITAGQSSSLSWSVTGATSLTLDQGIGAVTGTSRSVNPTLTTIYTLTATNAAGNATATTTVTVNPAPQLPVIASFTASPATIPAGQSSTLSWSVTGATSLSLNQGIGTVTGSSRNVSPTATTSYTLTATNAVGNVSANTTVTVQSSTSCNGASLGDNANLNGYRPFPDDNPWNKDVSSSAVDPNSSAIISYIGASAGLKADFGSGLWEGGPIGIPYTVVGGSQAKVNVNFTAYGDESDPGPMPIPATAPVEGGNASDGDRHVLVMDRDSCVLFELYRAFKQADGSWNADSAAIWDLKSNSGRPWGWTSSDAAGLPIYPGLVKYDEVLRGEINHAIRFTVPKTRKAYVPPASHWASSITDPNAPPMGMRVRLKASFDITAYPAQVQVILRALKKYGMILADNGSAWYMSGAPDERWNNDQLAQLRNIKGSDLEVVKMDVIHTTAPTGTAPVINSFTATPATITSGQSSTLSWSATHGDRYFITPGVGFVRSTSISVSPAVTTTYTLRVQGPYGQTSRTVTVTVGGSVTAPAITAQPQNVSVNAGQTASFSVTATGTPAPTYQWRKNGTAISGATSASYTTAATTTADHGAGFSVVVSNAGGSVTSQSALLSVSSLPSDPWSDAGKTVIDVCTVAQLQSAIATANAQGNVTIYLCDGTYQLTQLLLLSGNDVTLRSRSGDRSKVILKGRGALDSSLGWILQVQGKRFRIRDLSLGEVYHHGIQVHGEHDADGFHARNVRFYDIRTQMIKGSIATASVHCDEGIVEDCLFEYTAGLAYQYYCGGIDVHGGERWIVRNNTFRNIQLSSGSLTEGAIHFWNGARDTLVERNLIVNCDRGIMFGMDNSYHYGGILRNNMVHVTRDVGIYLCYAEGAQILHNSIWIASSYANALEYRFTQTKNVVIANNLANKAFAARDGATGTLNTNLATAQSAWFVQASSGNLHLASAVSGVVGAAHASYSVSQDFDGEARTAPCDLGADEIQPTNPSGALIIDHACTDLGRIPASWMAQAKQNLKIAFGHTSHGSQIVTGMNAMKGSTGSTYDFSYAWGYNASAFMNDSPFSGASDLGNPDRSAWATATRNLLNRSGGCNRNVVIWSWCGQADTSNPADIELYLNLMSQLERDFPAVKFVYMTGHLAGTGVNGNLHKRNEQIRAYCRANNKILFDFADIESHDPDGLVNYLPLMATDNCDYDSDGNGSRDKNWASAWIAAHPGHALTNQATACGDCAHSQRLNCILKARAFWWMMARMAGWGG